MNRLTRNIKTVASAHGLQLKDVAEKMGVSKQNFSASLNGNPTIGTLERVAQAIGCSIEEFFSTSITCPHCGKPININITTGE